MNDYFCVLPFFGAEYTPSGFTTPCCLLPTNTDIKQLQTEMLAGQRPIACQKCWKLEDQNKISDRQLKNSAFDFYKNQAIEFIEEDCRRGDYSTQIVKLYTSNLCNGTCVTCGPGLSTAWATLKKVKTFEIIGQDQLDLIPYKDLVMLSFVGGEPLFEKKNFDILEQLISIGNTDCFISLVTNGSIELNQKQQTILKQFKNLNICLSIDGIGPVFEYLRYPLKWTSILENIKLYRDLGIQLSVSYTISNVNVLYYNETIAWFDKEYLPHNHNIVSNPQQFSPSVLPQEIKDSYPELKNFFNNTSDDLINKFYASIDEQDRLKGIKINDFLPKLSMALDTVKKSSR